MYSTEPVKVYDHDFNSFSEGTIVPHGIYDLKRNEGYLTLGTSKDTSEFCCECIWDWWKDHGIFNYQNANSILVLADGGGSNSSRHYIFKEDLQKLVDKMGIEIRMAHYPPYTSKYNPIERQLFSHVTRVWAGMVFTDIEAVNAAAHRASTVMGLKVFSSVKDKVYATARKVADTFKANLPIVFDSFLGKWNYTAVPSN